MSLPVHKMSEEERSALLEKEHGPAQEIIGPRKKIKKLYESEQVLGRHGICLSHGQGGINLAGNSSILPSLAESDFIVSIFVVAFDTKAGVCFCV